MRREEVDFRKLVVVLGLVLLLSSFGIRTVFAQSGQVGLKPTDDTYADSDSPNYSWGGQEDLLFQNYLLYFNGETVESIVWLKFNLSSIPDGVVVDEATLHLYENGEVFVTPGVMTLFDVSAHSCSNDSWTELTLTYSNMLSYNTTSMDSVTVGTGYEWYNWSVVDAVRDALNGTAKTVTIVLEPSYGFDEPVAFDSKETPVSNLTDYAPELTVHWSSVVPEFPTSLMPPLLVMATTSYLMLCRKKTNLRKKDKKELVSKLKHSFV
jgi:hypothetical protein